MAHYRISSTSGEGSNPSEDGRQTRSERYPSLSQQQTSHKSVNMEADISDDSSNSHSSERHHHHNYASNTDVSTSIYIQSLNLKNQDYPQMYYLYTCRLRLIYYWCLSEYYFHYLEVHINVHS